jgi:prevent-host-death family protein
LIRMAKAEARKRFSEVTTRVGRRGERVKITHYGKTLAVLVSKQDLAKLDECEQDVQPQSQGKAQGKAQPKPQPKSQRRPSSGGDRGRRQR